MNEKNKLEKLYLKDCYSIRDIAKKIGMSYAGTRGKLIRYGIPLRTDKEGMNTSISRNKRSENAMGANNSQWNNGKNISISGYVKIYLPEHPNSFNKYVYEHRLVMEQKIGRYLTPEEEVHHIDEDKHNNDPDNLQLFASKAEHTRHHMKLKSKK